MKLTKSNVFTSSLKLFVMSCFVLFSITTQAHASLIGGIVKETGRFYLGVTSPVETINRKLIKNSHITEEQHITPQSHKGKIKDVVLITYSNHRISDTWKGGPFLKKHGYDGFSGLILPIVTFGNAKSLESLNAAYRTGACVYPYAIFRYGYTSDKVGLMCTELDAPSMFVYGVSWIINIPQKLVNKVAYIIDSDTKVTIFALLDIIPNIFMLALEIPLAVVGTVAGTVIAFIFSPIDSLCSFLGMFYFLILSVITAIWDLGLGLLRLLPFI